MSLNEEWGFKWTTPIHLGASHSCCQEVFPEKQRLEVFLSSLYFIIKAPQESPSYLYEESIKAP